jgi:hypothetical protein
LSRDAIDGGLAVVVQVGVERVIHFETDHFRDSRRHTVR